MGLGRNLRSLLRTRPYRYQVQGVRFLERTGGRALLGDDMGLGKTLQAIGWLLLHPEARPAVIVCPSSVKYNWERELRTHAGLSSTVLSGWKTRRTQGEILILNYAILKKWESEILRAKPRVLVMDESHYVKSRKAQRTRACLRLARKCRHVIALSGTPIVNRPIEFFPVLNMIAPQLFNSFWKYAMTYCGPKRNRWTNGWDFRGATNLDELHARVSPVMIRRLKEEVLSELPPRSDTILPVEIPMGDYLKARHRFEDWLREHGGEKSVERAMKAKGLVQLGKLKLIAAKGKKAAIKSWISDFLETGRKLVVFGIHKEILGAILQDFKKVSVLVDGSVSGRKRQDAVDRFQTDPRVRLLIGNIRAAGIGITLTAASTVLFTEVAWTPGEHDQAADRVRRIGQKSDRVDVYWIVARATIEERILSVLREKRSIIEAVLDGGEGEW